MTKVITEFESQYPVSARGQLPAKFLHFTVHAEHKPERANLRITNSNASFGRNDLRDMGH